MSDSDSVRWMVTFFHSEGKRQDERDFPKVDFWYPTKKASMEAGRASPPGIEGSWRHSRLEGPLATPIPVK